LRALAFEEQMQAAAKYPDSISVSGLAIHNRELQARSRLTQAVLDHLEHRPPHAARLHRFGQAEQQNAIDPRQQLAAASHALL